MVVEINQNTYKLIGGDISIDFINTVEWRKRADPHDLLETNDSLLKWSVEADLLSKSEADKVDAWAKTHIEEANYELKRAKSLRESLYNVFQSILYDNAPQVNNLDVINYELKKALAHTKLTARCQQYSLAIEKEINFEYVIWSIAYSAAKLLTSNRLICVKECSDEECGWMFLDESRNKSRKWCRMEDCGNRNKARKHYHASKNRM